MKIKNNLIILFAVAFCSFNCQQGKKDLILKYLDFENFCGSKRLNLLFFEIKITHQILYIYLETILL